jgi:hypothetical protein
MSIWYHASVVHSPERLAWVLTTSEQKLRLEFLRANVILLKTGDFERYVLYRFNHYFSLHWMILFIFQNDFVTMAIHRVCDLQPTTVPPMKTAMNAVAQALPVESVPASTQVISWDYILLNSQSGEIAIDGKEVNCRLQPAHKGGM